MKADPKAKAAPAVEAAPAHANSKKKMIIIALVVLLACGATGGGVFFMTRGHAPAKGHEEPEKKAEPPVFVAIEPFTVNLQPENGEQYLQTTITLQVAGQSQVDLIKLNMPQVRSRILLLLSSKKASEINNAEGKKQLTTEIIEQIKQPFSAKGKEQEVTGVFFTSFIIQAQ
ncbi:MAG: flagellar basal body-associated protein FliL [Burkholderiales bacterium]|nr:flagellar basal body-associated protein FliL [Burkholderiales bacterium]